MVLPIRSTMSGPEPEGAGTLEQGLGWKQLASAPAMPASTITSGLEGAWNDTPITWDNGYFDNLFNHDWVLTKSPAGAHQWTPKDEESARTVPDAHDPSKKHPPMMFTTDLALKLDPDVRPDLQAFPREPRGSSPMLSRRRGTS